MKVFVGFIIIMIIGGLSTVILIPTADLFIAAGISLLVVAKGMELIVDGLKGR